MKPFIFVFIELGSDSHDILVKAASITSVFFAVAIKRTVFRSLVVEAETINRLANIFFNKIFASIGFCEPTLRLFILDTRPFLLFLRCFNSVLEKKKKTDNKQFH